MDDNIESEEDLSHEADPNWDENEDGGV